MIARLQTARVAAAEPAGRKGPPPSLLRRLFRRGPWEMAATVLIALGVLMLMQPVFKWGFTHGFTVLLVGTLGFVIVSHFPED